MPSYILLWISKASANMCNKLQTVKQNVNTLHQECDQLKVEILEINEIHRNELLQRQEENDNLRKELGWLEHQCNAPNNASSCDTSSV
jgi:regulator of replication initiation timing